MGVRKRPDTGKWQAYWRDPSGRQRSKDFDRKRDAQRHEAEMRRAVENREWIDPRDGKVPVASLWDDYMATRSIKPSTRASYEEVWRLLVQPRWGRVSVNKVTTPDVLAWVNNMEGPRGPVSPGRARKAHQVLKSLLDVAVLAKRIGANPAILPKGSLPKITRKRAHIYLTPFQVHALARACGDHSTLILVLAYLGLRWGEAVALHVRDIDFARRRIRVQRSYSTAGGKTLLTTPKTHQEREIPVPKFLMRLLDQACAGKGEDDLIFASDALTPLDVNNFRDRIFKPGLRRAGLGDMRIHELRHTAASIAVANGANVNAIQRMLGHASAQMTLDVYAGLFDTDLDDLADSLDIAFLEASADSVLTAEEGQEAPGLEVIAEKSNVIRLFPESRLSESNRRPTHYECVALAD